MKRAAIGVLLGGVLVVAGAAVPAAGAPLVPAAPVAAAVVDSSVHLASHRAAHTYKHRRVKRYKSGLPAYPSRYHSWSRWDYRKKLHSRRYAGEKYHRHCHDWHRCHYYFYGYLQWQKWNPNGSRAAFLRKYHH
jgi:hypothetical protein